MPVDNVRIRREQSADLAAIREVNRRAFGQDQEGAIVDALRANGGVLLSLVAILDERIAGHILYSPARVGDLSGAALGPMAVLPDDQRQGIGSRLVEAGNELLRETGCPFIVVVGHPAFYRRFGFQPARTHRLACEWEVPDEVFMVKVLDGARVRGAAAGVVRYRPEFSANS
jgi:putative acetyltransferase